MTTTTHIQDGSLYRNGVPNSDKEVFTMYITRHGDDELSITAVVQDPVYLTPPPTWWPECGFTTRMGT